MKQQKKPWAERSFGERLAYVGTIVIVVCAAIYAYSSYRDGMAYEDAFRQYIDPQYTR